MAGRLIVVAGPSGVGKSPLVAALRRLHPDLDATLTRVVLYNSRDPRPGESDGVDYHFRRRSEIERLGDEPGFVACDVRGDLHCIDVGALDELLGSGGNAFFEGNPFIPEALRQAGVLDRYPTLTIFVSPLSEEEIGYLRVPVRNVDLGSFVTDVMRRKLLRRTRRQKGELSLPDLENIERRAASAIGELRLAWRYDYVIPNHDGEDNENWDAFYYPIGDAFAALESLVALLSDQPAPGVERWPEGLIPE
jgi:guanylate kinase